MFVIFPYKEDYVGIHRQRQIDVAIQLFEVMGITREDKEKRMEWMMRGFRQFDAPVSLGSYLRQIPRACRHNTIWLRLISLRHRASSMGPRLRLRN